METKYVRVPFDVELAKKITSKEIEGRIVTNLGKEVRIVCFDMLDEKAPIIGLRRDNGFNETALSFDLNGKCRQTNDIAIMLEIPEYMTFKDGDVIAFGFDKTDLSIGVFKKFILNTHEDYVTINKSGIQFDECDWTCRNLRYATETEKQKLIDALKESKDPQAKECLKKIGIEVKTEYEFKPKDWVLIRDDCDGTWCLDVFSHAEWDETEECYHYYCVGGWSYQCIPYNEDTVHLLGTTENYE